MIPMSSATVRAAKKGRRKRAMRIPCPRPPPPKTTSFAC
jgi:hypothetical protein